MAAPSPAQARALLRALLRESHKFSNYNIREYAKRRALQGFRECEELATDPQTAAAYFKQGQRDLELVKRQVVIYSLYRPPLKSVMDLPTPSSVGGEVEQAVGSAEGFPKVAYN